MSVLPAYVYITWMPMYISHGCLVPIEARIIGSPKAGITVVSHHVGPEN